jgi:hypothetical protein
MRHTLIAVVAGALLIAACGSSADSGVASLQDEATTDTTQASGDQPAVPDEDALLAFAQCMRDHGVEDFQDPVVGEDGGVTFGFRGPGGGAGDGGGGTFGGADRDTVQAAFLACGENLQGLAIGPGGGDFDPSEIQDQLVAFAQCLRDHGIDVDDPDFSDFGPQVNQNDSQDNGGQGQTFTSPFGPNFDPSDPDVQAAIEACQGEGGPFRIGGGPGGPPPDAGQGGA